MSGAQNWNGNALTLKAKPTTTNRIAANAAVSGPPEMCASFAAIPSRRVVPVSP